MIPFRKKQLPALLLLPYLSNCGNALSLGEPSLQSALGAPLLAEIPLTELNKLSDAQLSISLADPHDYQRLGVQRKQFHSKLDFKAVVGAGKAYIRVFSREATREPYVSFVLKVQWPDGSLIRHYTLLIDPSPALAQAPARLVQNQNGGNIRFTSTVQTRNGDSLWLLARRVQRPEGTNIAQVMNALYRINDHAFVAGQADKLLPGVPIKTPSAVQIAAEPRQFAAARSDRAAAITTTAAEIKPATGGSADSRKIVAAAAPGSTSKPSISDPHMQDQLEGIKAGIAAAEAGKVRNKAHIAVLEQELNALVERYEVLADKTRSLQAAESQKKVTASSRQNDNVSRQTGKSLLHFTAIMAGFAGAGYLLGQLLARPRKQQATKDNKRSMLARLMKQKPKGSNTYEKPFTNTAVDTVKGGTIKAGVRGAYHNSDGAKDGKDEDASVIASAYMAFGLHEDAENALAESILEHPERLDLKMQLLELYCKASMHERFDGMAETIMSDTDDPAIMIRVELLRLQLPLEDASDDEADAATENLHQRTG
jgi:pilus assembly protein FimV